MIFLSKGVEEKARMIDTYWAEDTYIAELGALCKRLVWTDAAKFVLEDVYLAESPLSVNIPIAGR